jgi:hypothetical protein
MAFDDSSNTRDNARVRRESIARIRVLAEAGDPEAIAYLERQESKAAPSEPNPTPH